MTIPPSASAIGTHRMRASLLVGVDRFVVREVPRAEPGPRDVLVRVRGVGLCGTDLHIAAGHANYHRDASGRPIPLAEEPQILGHEIAGVVEARGSAVRDLEPGDQVVIDQGRTCVSEGFSPVCEYCASGDSHQCERYREHGITGLPGGFAEYVTVPAANAVRLTTRLDPAVAALAEPLGCVVHALDVLARTPARYGVRAASRPARTIVVFGGGPAGLLFVQCLRRITGFDGTVLVAEPDPTKRELASRFGAEAIDPGTSDLAATVQERTAGRRAEVVIEASGAGSVFETMPRVLRKQGTVLLYGHGHAGVEMTTMNAVQFLEPRLLAPTGASGGHETDGRPTTYVRAAAMIADGTIDVASLITHRYHSLDAVPAAIADARGRRGYVKGVLTL